MPVVREVPQIVHLHCDQPLGLRAAHDPVLEEAREERRKDGDDVESHIFTIIIGSWKGRRTFAFLQELCSTVAQTIMPDIEGLLNRWLSAGVIEADAANRIRAWEAEQKLPPSSE